MPASSAAGRDAAAYDAWYDSPTGRPILATEVAALRPLIEVFAQPRLEIGDRRRFRRPARRAVRTRSIP
ncbi:hypothetical protein J113_13830 [Mycobacterium tuberculosis CAS/NITR204]|uniref:Uncharacterized protein n=1 Tax=Mycobacterium tuberculosis CAS/NITR204 TaxID=1310114 RepID=R4MHQ6_MYCTX|nr:hypothetical protein J113_13830 [Mycobacterium tuberculosis CAS/NITR204]